MGIRVMQLFPRDAAMAALLQIAFSVITFLIISNLKSIYIESDYIKRYSSIFFYRLRGNV